MENSELVLQSGNRQIEVAGKKGRAVRILKYILIIFLFSSMTGLSSCAVAVRDSQPQRHGFFFKRQSQPVYRSAKHDNGKGHGYGHQKAKGHGHDKHRK